MDRESSFKNLEEIFQEAERFVREKHPLDLEWSKNQISQVHLEEVTDEKFLQEYTYVVYCSGYKQKIVEKYWGKLWIIYMFFNPKWIAANKEDIRKRAARQIANTKKIGAILDTATKIASMDEQGWKSFKDKIKEEDSFAALQELPFIGPITKYHLARNLGFNVIKPDVHLQRMADHFGINPFEMCRKLSEKSEQLTGRHYPVHTVDTILWRASAEGVIKWSDSE